MTVEVSLQHRLGELELDLSFSVGDAGVTALFGPSGAGKSCTINAVAGLLKPRRGKVVVNGKVVMDTEAGIFVPPRQRRLGYVFQDARLFPHLTVEQNLLYGWRRSGKWASKQEIAALIDLLGITKLITRRPRMLSGGEKQRVALGRALLTKPELLLLDEPLAALDHKRRNEILPYLERVRAEHQTPMLYVSHSIDEVTRLADNVQILNDGKIVAAGSVAELFSRIDLFPITGRFEAGAVVDGTVRSHDETYQLSHIGFDGGELTVPRLDAALGETVRVRVRARDIMVALEAPQAISANNILPATVSGVRTDASTYADVQLSCGNARLVARITRQSYERLNLIEGKPVYAVIKSATIDRRRTQ